MSNVLDELTKTLLRLGRRGEVRPGDSKGPDETIPAPPPVEEGSQFGRYLIERRIGAGGMGHVYLATDTRLRRKVALKFLSPTLVSNRDSLRRLEAEAQTASGLNHPNILTIYEIGELNGHHYIASEYIEGQTLRTAMNRKTLDVQGAIDIMCQVLSALAAAHKAGVVHRDLKPGNVMIRPDGYVKVIDFGLAKRTRREATDVSALASLTREGLVVGTVQYMSPEQACGDDVDHRTDIWSVGIILFEIVARRRPFDGDTESRIVRNICSKPVPEIARGDNLPDGLMAVIDRALQKDPDDRYQNAQEMLEDLSTVGIGGQSLLARSASLMKPKRSRWPLLAGWIAALVVIAVALWIGATRSGWFGPNWFQIDKVRQVTFNGRVIQSAISPDGKYLAYSAGDQRGIQTVYLVQLNGAAEAVKIPPRNVNYVGLSFSPDDQLYVVAKSYDDLIGRAYEVPVVGDPPEKPFLVDVDGPIAFSRDGTKIAFVRWEREGEKTRSSLLIRSRDGSNTQTLFSITDFNILQYLAWSPKDDRIATILLSHSGSSGGRRLLTLIGIDKSREQHPLPDWGFLSGLCWNSDGRSILLTAAGPDESASQAQLRQVDVRSAEVRTLTREVSGFWTPSLTVDGNQLAITKVQPHATLWISEKGRFSQGQQFSADLDRRPTLDWISEDKLLISSLRGGYPNLWVRDVNTSNTERLTHEVQAEQEGVAIPGSNSLVYSAKKTGQYKLWRFDTDTGKDTQLTFGANLDAAPSVSPDGKYIAYASWSGATTPHVAIVPTTGGDSKPLGQFLAQKPAWSPDGKQILCELQDPRTRKWSTAIVTLADPEHFRLLPSISWPAVWSQQGKAIAYVITDRHGVSNIWEMPLNGRTPRALTSFGEQEILKLAISKSGDRLACLRASLPRDVELYLRAKR